MRQDERAPFVLALEEARVAAYPAGEFVGQESFMTAGEILELARRAGIGAGVSVLDLCCGVAGPGGYLTAELGCDYLGLDYSADALRIARERTLGLPCRFEVARVPDLPDVRADVVLLLETLLAFESKVDLVQAVSGVLPVGGRFATTVEAGLPLTPAEQARMPDADTVHLTPLPSFVRLLADAGLHVTWQRDLSLAHASIARSLLRGFAARESAIAAGIGRRALDELLAAHLLWSEWLGSGRVRKVALVAERR